MNKEISVLTKELPGEDLLEGKSHERIANNIIRQIKHGNSKLIGIEGKWGSGKSNVLKIIEKNIEKQNLEKQKSEDKFIFFQYNAWLHQNDLHRRIIPTEMYEFFNNMNEECITKKQKNDLSKNLRVLLGTVTETTINRIPRFSWGMIIIIFGIIISPIINTILGKAYDKDDLTLCKYILWNAYIVLIPFIILLFIYIKNLIKKKNNPFKQAFLELIAIYKTTETEKVEDTSITYTKEKNPTYSDFQTFMQSISSIIGKRKMIIVFDDIDRMQKENIQEFWGTLHNLFVNTSYDNIFFIVPFGRDQLKNVFEKNDDDEYINKTFDIIYRVSLPILSDYALFFKTKWEEAFGDTITVDQFNYVWRIFDGYSRNITPRNIIAFINEFITVKQFFENKIPEEYIALFIMRKDMILDNPSENIIKLNFLGNLTTFYKDNEETIKYLTALAFQIEPEKALDIVYRSFLKRILDNGLTNEIENFIDSKIFYYLLLPLLPELNNIDKAIISLDHIAEKMNLNKQVWDDIFKIVIGKHETIPKNCEEALPYQSALIRHITKEQIYEYLNVLLQYFCKDGIAFTSIGYFKVISALKEELAKREFDINNILKNLPKKKVLPEEYIKLVEHAGAKYSELNIICSENELDTFLASKNVAGLGSLGFTKYLNEKDRLNRYKNKLSDFYKNCLSDHIVLPVIIERMKDMNMLINDIGIIPVNTMVNMYNGAVNQKSNFIYDLIAMRFSISSPQLQDMNLNNIFANYLKNNGKKNEYVSKVAAVIQNYITFGNILINLPSMSVYQLYVNVVHHILENKSGKSCTIIPILQKFEDICNKGKIEPQLLIDNLSIWHEQLKEYDGKQDYSAIFSIYFVKEILKSKTDLAKHCIEQLKNYLDNFPKEKWKESIQKKDSYETQVTIELDYKYNTFAKEAIHELLLEVANRDREQVDCTHYAKIIGHMSKKDVSFINTFNSVRDILCQKGELSVNGFLFWAEWLFKYAELNKKQEVLRTILPVSLLDNEECIKIIHANRTFLPEIIKVAGNERDGFINGLKARLGKKQNSPLLNEIAGTLDIKVVDNESKKETDIINK